MLNRICYVRLGCGMAMYTSELTDSLSVAVAALHCVAFSGVGSSPGVERFPPGVRGIPRGAGVVAARFGAGVTA